MKRLVLTATLAIGLLAACSPAATPSPVPVVTVAPSLPSASGLSTLAPSPSSGASLSPSRTP